MRKIPKSSLEKKIQDINPHWATGEIDSDIREYRKRKYFDLLFPLAVESTVNRALVLMGPRRVGKTVLLHQIIQQLLESKVDPKSIVYLSLDIPLFQGLSLEELLDHYLSSSRRPEIEGSIVIFDEIQYLPDWQRHLKVLVDQHRDAMFIASGSAAAALRLKSLESGAGRFTEFKLPPLTFYEYLNLIGYDQGQVLSEEIVELNREFLNYINYGGYPEAIFDARIRENPERYIRSDIVEKVLLRDLPNLYGISDTQELTRLFNSLAYQTGNEISYEALSQTSDITKGTIKRYIEYLEAAFLIKSIDRVDNTGKKFKKANFRKLYLTNPSMYTALFGLVRDDDDSIGHLVETALVSQLLHSEESLYRIYYARWPGGRGEVDIVFLDNRFRVVSCVEVKWTDRYFEKPHMLKHVISFSHQCKLTEALITTRSRRGVRKSINGIDMVFIESARLCYLIGKNIIEGKMEISVAEISKIDESSGDQLELGLSI